MCCGQGRRNIVSSTPGTGTRSSPTVRATGSQYQGSQPRALNYVVMFEYTGPTGLTVFGPVSNARYRFDRRGSRVRVDPRDRPGLTAVPNLRQVT